MLALVDHAPTPGNEYPPVDDLIVSIVLRSNHGMVERELDGAHQVFRETPNSIIITPPRTASFWAFSGTPQVIHIVMSAAWVDELYRARCADVDRQIAQLSRAPVSDPFIARLAERMWLSSADDSMLGRMVTERAAGLLLPSLLKRDYDVHASANGAGLAPWRYKRALALLSRLDVNVSTTDIAREIGLSTSHFVRAFKSTTGQSPHQWQSAQRIDEAKDLLRRSKMTFTNIAVSLGYSSSGHFSTAFRRATGMTPRQWRSGFQLANSPLDP